MNYNFEKDLELIDGRIVILKELDTTEAWEEVQELLLMKLQIVALSVQVEQIKNSSEADWK